MPVVEVFSLQKFIKMLDEVVASWQEVKWIWQMRQNFIAQFIQLLKGCLWNILLGLFVEIWVHSVDQCWLQALNFSVYLTNLLSILLRCNSFTRIQKAVLDQTKSRPPKQWPSPFFGVSLALGSTLELLSPNTKLVVSSCHIKSTFHHRSQSDWRNGLLLLHRLREDNTWKQQFFLFSIMRHPLIELFHLSNFLQMLNSCRMGHLEFFSNFLCSYKRINLCNYFQLIIVNLQWPTTALLIFEALVSLQNFLNNHCTVYSLAVPGPKALLMLWVISTALWPILN